MYRFARVRISLDAVVVLGTGCIVAGPIRAQSSASPAKELTVERIYSAPSLSGHLTEGIEWTPDSKRISYIVRKGRGRMRRRNFGRWTGQPASARCSSARMR